MILHRRSSRNQRLFALHYCNNLSIPVVRWKRGGFRMCPTQGCKSIQTPSSFCLRAVQKECRQSDQRKPQSSWHKEHLEGFFFFLEVCDIWNSGKIWIQEPCAQSKHYKLTRVLMCPLCYFLTHSRPGHYFNSHFSPVKFLHSFTPAKQAKTKNFMSVELLQLSEPGRVSPGLHHITLQLCSTLFVCFLNIALLAADNRNL